MPKNQQSISCASNTYENIDLNTALQAILSVWKRPLQLLVTHLVGEKIMTVEKIGSVIKRDKSTVSRNLILRGQDAK